MRVSITLIFLLLICSCATSKRVAVEYRDSVRVEVVERRVVICDTVILQIPYEVERVRIMQDTSLLRNSYSLSEAIICPDGALHHTLETLEQSIEWPIATQVEVRDSVLYRERVVTNIVEVERKLSGWQQFQITGFNILLIVVAALLLLWRLF